MALIEKPAAGGGRGAARWLVNPPSRFSGPTHLLLRPLYNEYPERWPINPAFPQPGRRGASRPPASAGAEETTPVVIVPTFPRPRERGPVEHVGDPTGGAPIPEGTAGKACYPRGNTFSLWEAVANGNSTYFLSPTIWGPFIVTHYMILHDCGAGGSAAIKLMVGLGEGPTGPSDDSGFPIFGNPGGWSVEQDPRDQRLEGYPNLHVPEGPHHLKARFRNNSGGAGEFQYLIDIIYVD